MRSTIILFALLLVFVPLLYAGDNPETKVPIVFTGGYDTDPQDRGRPVILVASALGVPADVFREAFSHVHPAGPGSGGPSPDQARANKEALMKVLGPYGITNDRLDEVSNQYRYRRSDGELWKHTPAEAYAMVKDGHVVSITVTNPGCGYSSAPTASIAGLPDAKFTVTLTFDKDFAKNGSIKEIVPTAKTP